MIGMVVATDLEAMPILKWPGWQEVTTKPFKIYRGCMVFGKTPTLLIISGIGKVAAAVATHVLICQYGVTRLINPGVCGALSEVDEFKIGKIFRISTAIEGDRQEGPYAAKAEKCTDDSLDGLPCARLVTCDRPVFDNQWKIVLSAMGDLVDMEGAAIVRVANMYALPCSLIKGITDSAKEGDRQVLIQNVGMVSQQLANFFESFQGEW